ncbi:hypothetical protein B7435_23030, partial [Mycolicibacterium peregrinum]
MTVVGARTSPEGAKYPKLPHPPRRVPLLGDIFGLQLDSAMQNAMGMAELGPICEFRFLGASYVVAAGA